jgi:D-alanyl-D-alanine carboxypeptidase/D-alanyl-D-alanine-endopeptidase (penicillin-binding protein 4)
VTPACLRCLLALVLCASALASPAQTALPESVQAALRAARIAPEALGAVVLPLNGAKERLSHQAGQAMAPASTLKLLTTAVALDELGPTFRWRTQLLAEREVIGDTLRGPFYLRGGADPSLSWQRLQTLLRELRAQGVRHLRGDLVLDRSYFSPQRPDLGQPDFDESPDAYYNVIPDALLVNSNLLELTVRANAQHVKLELRTPLAGVQLHSALRLIDGDCKDWDEAWLTPSLRLGRGGLLHVTLQGSFPRNCTARAATNVLARNDFIARALRAQWRELGGDWVGQVRDGATPTSARLLVEQASDTLADSVKLVNKRSDNAMARSLYLSLGAQPARTQAEANHFDAARTRVQGWLTRQGIDPAGLVLDNGSGLSRTERISARQLAQVLQAAARGRWYAEFATSLPIAALDGGMRKRLQNTPAALQARIKTGTLRDSAAVAGYVRDTAGQDWIVVAVINDPASRLGRPALDALIEWVANAPAALALVASP